MSVSVGKREWFSFGRTEELTMIVEERGIPVWTRVRFPPGPLPKNQRNNVFMGFVKHLKMFKFITLDRFKSFQIEMNVVRNNVKTIWYFGIIFDE